MTERSVAPRVVAGGIGPDARAARILLVEDDEGDAFLVRELLNEAEAPFELVVATACARPGACCAASSACCSTSACPTRRGIDGLRRLLAIAGSAAVCVLTGRSDEHLGVAAVAEGAQDYLVKGQVDGVLLIRALRYAVERKRADENARRLREVELRPGRVGRLWSAACCPSR
jgi:DNA-binding NarL/FixJ family response regulator